MFPMKLEGLLVPKEEKSDEVTTPDEPNKKRGRLSTETEEKKITTTQALTPTEIKDDGRSEAIIIFKKKRFSKMKGRVFSPTFMIRNLPWRILMMRTTTPNTTIKFLSVFVHCDGETGDSTCSCSAKVYLSLLSQKEGVMNMNFSKFEHVFTPPYFAFGYPKFLPWNDILNIERGLIKDDTIILQAHVIADAPTCVSLKPKKHALAAPEAVNYFNRPATKSTIREQIELLFNNERMADVHFIVGSSDLKNGTGKRMRVPAHKLILATGSEVFYAMFYGSLYEKKDEIEIPDIEPVAFLILLRYLYGEDVKLEDDSVVATFYAAEKYQVPHLTEACTKYLESTVTIDNACLLLSRCRFFDLPGLRKICWEIIDAQTQKALESDSFLEIDSCTLESILKRETLNCREICIFEAALDWAVEECIRKDLDRTPANKRSVLGDLLYLIRIPVMSVEEFANRAISYGIFSPDESNNIFIHLASSTNKPSLAFPTTPRAGYKSQSHE